MSVSVHPIGHVRKQADRTWIVLEPQYQPGLLGLEEFSHIHVLWWFHLNDTPEKRATLQVHPRGNPQNPLTGVFATRSPARPNLIGLTLCRIVAIRPLEVELETIDALDGTPVLDIKPFLPAFDTAGGVRAPDWIKDGLRPPSDGPKAGRKRSAPRSPDRTNPPPNE
jgi:tRNA-Thr(GGU) m(6)t(6)A37 methyltransferase TsaA